RVLDVKCEQSDQIHVMDELWSADGRETDVDLRQTLVEQVLRYPGGRNVLSRLHGLAPARMRVERIECDVALFVRDLDLWKARLASPKDDAAAPDANRLWHVNSGGGRAFLLHDMRRGDCVG